MKKLIILIMMVPFLSLSQVRMDSKGNFYSQSAKKDSIELTPKIYTDSKGNMYSVYVNSQGKYFILKTSKKTGKQYRQYLKINC